MRYLILSLLTLLLMAGTSCHTIHTTVSSRSDTLIHLRPISLPYDTSLRLAADSAIAVIDLRNMDWREITGPSIETTVKGQRISLHTTLQHGILKIKAETGDSSIAIKGTAEGIGADTTIHELKTVTIVKEPSTFGKIWSGFKNSMLIIVLIAAAIIVCILIIRR